MKSRKRVSNSLLFLQRQHHGVVDGLERIAPAGRSRSSTGMPLPFQRDELRRRPGSNRSNWRTAVGRPR